MQNKKEKQQAILKTIEQFDTIIIHRHVRPDPDAIGAQSGLADLIKQTFPKKKVYIAGEVPEDLHYLAKMDKVLKERYENALVIVVDTANTARIDGMNYSLGKKWIKIDHHPNDEPYGDLVYVDTKASSCSELIAEFYFDHQEHLKLSSNGARLLYAGIVGDTGRFLYPATTKKTLFIASQLRTFDFDAATLNRQLDQVSFKIAKVFGYVYDHLVADSFGAGKIILSLEVLAQYGVNDDEIHAIVSLPGKIDQVKAWCIFIEQRDHTYRTHLRSKGPIINELAKQHRGGGHPLASGAKAKNLDEVHQTYQELQHLVETFYKKA